jgi:hypothetical protein
VDTRGLDVDPVPALAEHHHALQRMERALAPLDVVNETEELGTILRIAIEPQDARRSSLPDALARGALDRLRAEGPTAPRPATAQIDRAAARTAARPRALGVAPIGILTFPTFAPTATESPRHTAYCAGHEASSV